MAFLTLQLPPPLKLTEDEFEQIVAVNPELRLELTANGELVIMAPTGGETGSKNFDLIGQIWYWNRQHNLGIAFDSSSGFKLPNGATRFPDASWIPIAKWNNLTPQQRKKFLPLCPDFVVELVSETDDIAATRAKMQEYISHGAKLGWFIIPQLQQVEIYRPQQPAEVLQSPSQLSGEDILPGLVVDLRLILG